METTSTSMADSARILNRRLKLEDPPDPRNEKGAPLGTGRRISTRSNNSEASLDEDVARRQEATILGWIARWRQTRRDGHAVVARHPFGYEVAQ
jgi:hypothetical protein